MKVLLSQVLIVLEMRTFLDFAIRFDQDLTAPLVSLLALLDQTLMELRIREDFTVVSLVVDQEL